MNLRKLILLMLPVSVAFIIGGKSGTLINIHEFQWPVAIAWGTVIAIIDYNFSMIKKMGTLAIVGRIVLVLSSAAITATVGDHIIFEDTLDKIAITNEGESITKDGNSPEVIRYKGKVDEADALVKDLTGQIATMNKEILHEINHGGCKGRCKDKQALLPGLNSGLVDAKANRAEAKTSLKELTALQASNRQSIKQGNDLITEIQDLYAYIFDVENRGYGGAIMFSIFVMMTICIETLPLMLKSGLTEDDVQEEDRKNREKKNTENFQNTQTILRNNAY